MINFGNYKKRYLSSEDDFIEDFYKPIISETVEYKRMTGYFSGRLIENIYKEISRNELEENYIMKIICSPKISFEDQINIQKGYELKKLIEEKIIHSIEKLDLKCLPAITRLIANGVIDIKFVTTKSGQGIFHSKEGTFIDEYNNKLSITGSNNETSAAIKYNYESFIVLKSNIQSDNEIINDIEETFDKIWEDKENDLIHCEITPLIMDAFKQAERKIFEKNKVNDKVNRKTIEKLFDLYPYQKDAIDKWRENDYLGLLEMATGTGKTITALACQEMLNREIDNLTTIIVAPQIDLVNQWSEELNVLNIEAIKCHSQEQNYNLLLRTGLLKQNHFNKPLFIITTSSTFSSREFQSTLELYLNSDTLLICDEVHSFGSDSMRKLYDNLSNKFQYRLGVSATPFRRDDEESQKLVDFFDKIIFKYTLKDAIDNNFLNKYKYIPIVLSFDKNDLEEYRTSLIQKVNSNISNKVILKEVDRLTSTIANSNIKKVEKLKELLDKENIKNQKIVYCSPGTYNDGNNILNERHINYVAQKLGEHGCRLRMIYSDISSEDRMNILHNFKNRELDTLLAIKCLDQGVNLKEVTHAYILSSTDSLTEFIQRRGRILRKSPGKSTSYIYDLIMLPESLDSFYFNPTFEDAYLVDRELRRMKEYNYAAINKLENEKVINDIEEAYSYVLEELNHVKNR